MYYFDSSKLLIPTVWFSLDVETVDRLGCRKFLPMYIADGGHNGGRRSLLEDSLLETLLL